jgi:transposase
MHCQQLSGFLFRQGCHYARPAWTNPHRRWLAGLRFELAVHDIVLEDYVQAVEDAEARRDRLTAQIEAMLSDRTLAPVVAALQTTRGMALVNAATLIAELGDLSRFANPRQLMAYLGLVPCEHSSGASVASDGRPRHCAAPGIASTSLVEIKSFGAAALRRFSVGRQSVKAKVLALLHITHNDLRR